MDLSAAGTVDGPLTPPLPETTWIQPLPDGRIVGDGADPGELMQARESVRLAFVAALQHLPPRQRAVLILREVLGFRAAEVAEQLDTTVASVNSALQRARAALDARDEPAGELADPRDDAQRELLERYLAAFEAYDIAALTELLHDDAVQSMPPYPLWLRGRDQVLGWWTGPGAECRGSRVVPAPSANGLPAFGQYRPSGPGGRHEPWALQVLEIDGGRIAGFTAFLDTATLFPLFGLPEHPDG